MEHSEIWNRGHRTGFASRFHGRTEKSRNCPEGASSSHDGFRNVKLALDAVRIYSIVMDDRTYTVALVAEGLASSDRIAAELRFIAALERVLGAPQAVASTYGAWISANESQADEIDQETAELAVRWPQAFQIATRAGLRDLHDIVEAVFELQLTGAGWAPPAVENEDSVAITTGGVHEDRDTREGYRPRDLHHGCDPRWDELHAF